MKNSLFVFLSFFASLGFNMVALAAADNNTQTRHIKLIGTNKYGQKFNCSFGDDGVSLKGETDQEQYRNLIMAFKNWAEKEWKISEERGETFEFPDLSEWAQDKARFIVFLASQPATRECFICNENASEEQKVRDLHVEDYKSKHPDSFICENCLNTLPSDECPICREVGFMANENVGTIEYAK